MTDVLQIFDTFAASYAATVGIALVCAYLGLFTVLRRIVFTGVALAQLAAAGVAGAIYLGDRGPAWMTEAARAHGPTVGSLGLAILGAVGLEARGDRKRVSADALVGLAYAGAAALSILFVNQSAQGLAELKNILAGEVLLARSGELRALWIGLIAVAAVQLRYRRVFLLVSYDPEFARAQGLPERRYQSLFMISLAVAVALSLKTGGLVLVFALLVLPAVAGLQLGRTLTESTWLALSAAVASALLGFVVAIVQNLPVAPTVAATLLALVGVAWLGSLHERVGQIVRAVFGALAALALVAAVFAGGKALMTPSLEGPASPSAPGGPRAKALDPHAHEHDHEHPEPGFDVEAEIKALRESESPEQRRAAAQHLEDLADDKALMPLVTAIADEDAGVRKAAGAAIACLAAQEGVLDRLRAASKGADGEVRLHAALALVRVGRLEGVQALVEALADEEVPVFSKEPALRELRRMNGNASLGFDPLADDNAAAIAAWRAWWANTGKRLHWDARAQRFRGGE